MLTLEQATEELHDAIRVVAEAARDVANTQNVDWSNGELVDKNALKTLRQALDTWTEASKRFAGLDPVLAIALPLFEKP